VASSRRSNLAQQLKHGIHSELTHAVTRKDLGAVDRLLQNSNTDVNWRGIFGNTALHWAIANTDTRMASYLIEKVNDINFATQDDRHKTVLHLAIGKGWNHFSDSTPGGNEPPQAPVIHTLIHKMSKPQLDIQDQYGNTALHIAVMRRDFSVVELLLQKGAQGNIQNKQDLTPLEMLNSSYRDVVGFVRAYVSVFTISEDIWKGNEENIKELFKLYQNHEEKEEKEEKLSVVNVAPVNVAPVKVTPSGKDELIDNPDIIFEQAILFLEDKIELLKEQEDQKISKPFKQLLSAINKLKKQTHVLPNQDRKEIATATLDLSWKVASVCVEQEDIDAFNTATANYANQAPGLLAPALTAVAIAAIVAMVALNALTLAPVVAAIGLYTGTKAILMSVAAGCALGAVGFWGSRRMVDKRPPYREANEAAGQIKSIQPVRVPSGSV